MYGSLPDTSQQNRTPAENMVRTVCDTKAAARFHRDNMRSAFQPQLVRSQNLARSAYHERPNLTSRLKQSDAKFRRSGIRRTSEKDRQGRYQYPDLESVRNNSHLELDLFPSPTAIVIIVRGHSRLDE